MKVRNIGNNQTEVQTDSFNILVSYAVPVACFNKETGLYARTDKKWSATTTRHISAWLGDSGPIKVLNQSYFNKLLEIS